MTESFDEKKEDPRSLKDIKIDKESAKVPDPREKDLILYCLEAGDKETFCDFLNGKGFYVIPEKEYACGIPEKMSSDIFDILKERCESECFLSRDALASLLNETYEKIDSLIPNKESSLFEENNSFMEAFISKNVLDPDIEKKTSLAVSVLNFIDCRVLSPEKRACYKEDMLSSLKDSSFYNYNDTLGEGWDRDVSVLSKTFGIDSSVACFTVYAAVQSDAGIEDVSSLIRALTRVQNFLPSRINDALVRYPGQDIGSDLNVSLIPFVSASSSETKAVKEAALFLLGKDVPERYVSSCENPVPEDVLDFYQRLSFGYDESLVYFFRSLTQTLGVRALREEISETGLECAVKDFLGYKSEVFNSDDVFVREVLSLHSTEALKTFMDDTRTFSSGYVRKTEWPESLIENIFMFYEEEDPENFSRRELNRAFDYVMNTPAYLRSDVFEEGSALSADERETLMSCLIESSVDFGCSFDKVRNTFSAFVNLKSFIDEKVPEKGKAAVLTHKFYGLAMYDLFDSPASASLSDYKTFSEFAEGLSDGSVSDVKTALENLKGKNTERKGRGESR